MLGRARPEIDPERRRAILEAVGQKVGQLRSGVGLTQEAFAERLGIERSYVQKIELGLVNVSVLTLARLADSLGVQMAELLLAPRKAERRTGRPRKRP